MSKNTNTLSTIVVTAEDAKAQVQRAGAAGKSAWFLTCRAIAACYVAGIVGAEGKDYTTRTLATALHLSGPSRVTIGRRVGMVLMSGVVTEDTFDSIPRLAQYAGSKEVGAVLEGDKAITKTALVNAVKAAHKAAELKSGKVPTKALGGSDGDAGTPGTGGDDTETRKAQTSGPIVAQSLSGMVDQMESIALRLSSETLTKATRARIASVIETLTAAVEPKPKATPATVAASVATRESTPAVQVG